MPSRAVLRKKARREAKRQKAQSSEASTSAAATTAPAVGNTAAMTTTVTKPTSTTTTTTTMMRRTMGTTKQTATTAAPAEVASAGHGVAARPSRRVERKRPRAASDDGDEAADANTQTARLTHRERMKLASQRRLERQIARLAQAPPPQRRRTEDDEAATAAAASTTMADDAHGSGSATEAAAAAAEPPPRHDARFVNGTFWRTRKEQRARTLFLGGVPATYTVAAVKDFIASVLDADAEHAAVHMPPQQQQQHQQQEQEQQQTTYSDDKGDVAARGEVVEHVDVLSGKRRSGVQHMYVRMASVALAGRVAAQLDGYAMAEGRRLRCNFAGDKTQRAEAIRRRQTGAQR